MKLGDKEYTPRYPIMSCIALENVTNKSAIDLVSEVTGKKIPSIGTITAIVWAGLLADNDGLTLESVAEMIGNRQESDFVEIYRECRNALVASMSQLLTLDKKGDADKDEAPLKN